ncbi:MAG: hypothetical protein P1U34_10300 [Coxiellaceae bacterium]|nr:hypothetical protein [Coxiellaceae bacterium]
MRTTTSCTLGGSVFFIDSDVLASDSYSRFRKGVHRLVNNPTTPGMAVITIDTDRHPDFAITADNLIALLAKSRLAEYRPMHFLVVNESEQYLLSLGADNTLRRANTTKVHRDTHFTTVCHTDSKASVDKIVARLSAGRPDLAFESKELSTISDLDLTLADMAVTPILRKVPKTAAVIPSLESAPTGDWHDTLKKLNLDSRAVCPSDRWVSGFSSHSTEKPKKIIISMAAVSNTDTQGRDRWGSICHTSEGQPAICPRAPHRIITNALRSASSSGNVKREKDILGFVDLTRPMYLPHTSNDTTAATIKLDEDARAHEVHAKVLDNDGNYYTASYVDQPIASRPTLFRRKLFTSGYTTGTPHIYSKLEKEDALMAAVMAMNVFSNALETGELDYVEEVKHRFSLLVKTTEGMFLHHYKYNPHEGYPQLVRKPKPVADDYLESCDVTVIADRFEREATKKAIGAICHNDISHITMVDADQMVTNAINPFAAVRQELDAASLMGTPTSLKSSTTSSVHSGSVHSGLKQEVISDDHEALSTLGHTGVPADAKVENKLEGSSASHGDKDEEYVEPVSDDPSLSPAISGQLTPPYLRDAAPEAPPTPPAPTAARRRKRQGIAIAAQQEESKDASATPPLFVKRGHPPRQPGPAATSRFRLFNSHKPSRSKVAPMPTPRIEVTRHNSRR